MLFVQANEATAVFRRVYFDLRGTDGITPATGEAGGQPQISSGGGAWTNTGIGTLVAIGNGRFYADLTQAAVLTAGTVIETRYKSANTAEIPGQSVQVVGFNPRVNFSGSADAGTPNGVSLLNGAGVMATDVASIAGDGSAPSRLVLFANLAVDPDTGVASAQVVGYAGSNDPPSMLLVNPGDKLLTDAQGHVTSTNGGGGGGGSINVGATAVDWNYGGGNMGVYRTQNAVTTGVSGIQVFAYLSSEYAALKTLAPLRGYAVTKDDGTWTGMMLTSGLMYTLIADPRDGTGAKVLTLTV